MGRGIQFPKGSGPLARTMPPALYWCASLASKQLIHLGGAPYQKNLQKKITFAGHVISSEGVKPDPKKLKPIKEFPQPANVTEIKSFMGLANQTYFNLDIAHMGM